MGGGIIDLHHNNISATKEWYIEEGNSQIPLSHSVYRFISLSGCGIWKRVNLIYHSKRPIFNLDLILHDWYLIWWCGVMLKRE